MSHVFPHTYDKEEKVATTTDSDIQLTKLDEMDDVEIVGSPSQYI